MVSSSKCTFLKKGTTAYPVPFRRKFMKLELHFTFTSCYSVWASTIEKSHFTLRISHLVSFQQAPQTSIFETSWSGTYYQGLVQFCEVGRLQSRRESMGCSHPQMVMFHVGAKLQRPSRALLQNMDAHVQIIPWHVIKRPLHSKH